ncbi:MAG: esterase, partial [Betaproteobacteria bacterium]
MEQKKDMEAASPVTSTREHSVPLFWPLAAAYAMGQAELELFRKNLKFVIEAQKVDHGLKPRFATPNTVLLEL